MKTQDLPPEQRGPSNWYGSELADRPDDWLTELSVEAIQELESATESALDSHQDIHSITRDDFPLPTLAPPLREMRIALLSGLGFGLWRGLPVSSYSPRELAAMFFGIGTHLGNARSQNAQGHLLGHVRNMGLTSESPDVRIYQTNERQSFHTDSCDVVGLLCVKKARTGGESLLVSGDTVYNELRRRSPELLSLLLDPIATDRRGEVPEGMAPYVLIPVFSYFQSRITVFYQRQYIESAQRFDDAPRLTPAHDQALDMFDELCNDPRLNLSMILEEGDLQFVYNHALLHDRTAFEDHPEPERRRHLLRLWLSVPGDRALPDVFASRFGSVTPGSRGGITISGTEPAVNWDGRETGR